VTIPRTELHSTASAATSFTTLIAMENDNLSGIHVVYSGTDAEARARVKYTYARDASVFIDLHPTWLTMTASAGLKAFIQAHAPFPFLAVEYDAKAVTTGTVSVYTTRMTYG